MTYPVLLENSNYTTIVQKEEIMNTLLETRSKFVSYLKVYNKIKN